MKTAHGVIGAAIRDSSITSICTHHAEEAQ